MNGLCKVSIIQGRLQSDHIGQDTQNSHQSRQNTAKTWLNSDAKTAQPEMFMQI